MLGHAAVAILILIAALHSVLGEQALLRPLFGKDWELPVPRVAAERIFRFAWHLTSVAWVGIAVAVAGVPLLHAAAMVCIISGAVILVALRGHLAWPLFFAAGACIWASMDAVPAVVLHGFVLAGAGVSVVLAALHVHWGLGGRWGLAAALPQRADGSAVFEPGPAVCLAVAVACASLGGLLSWSSLADSPTFMRVGLWIALAVLVVRAVGDGRQVGFTKSDRATAFARADDALYSPLVVGLAFACGAALLLA